MHKLIKLSFLIVVVFAITTIGAMAQFNLISVQQINLDTLNSEQNGANILMTQEGDIVVAWGSLAQSSPYYDLYMAISTNGGQTFSNEIKVNDISGFCRVGGEEVPGMVENSAHDLVFSWTDMRHGTANSDIYARIRTADGAFLDTFRLNDDQTFLAQYLPSMLRVGNGDTLVAAWQDGRVCYSGCLSVFATMSVDGGYTWYPDIRASVQDFLDEISNNCLPAIGIRDDGEVKVAFRNSIDYYREIYAASANESFTAFDSPVRVDSTGWWRLTCPRSGPALIQHSSGDWVCAYMDGSSGTDKIFTARSTDDCASFDDAVAVGGDQAQNYPQLLELYDGRLLIAFQEKLPGQSNTRIVGSISYDVGITWEPLFQMSDDVVSQKSNVRLAYDGLVTLYAVWVDNRVGDKNIYFAELEGGVLSTDETPQLPESESILAAYPNPFNASCKITVSDRNVDKVYLYDITGRLVETLNINGGEATWNAASVPSGVYFARAAGPTGVASVKLLLLK